MTNQSEGPAVEKARCERCGIAKPEHINHLWACCGDGPGYGDQIKPETVECLRRQLEALRAELATELDGRTHLEEAAELLKRRPTIIDGIQGLYDWMQDVESWKARDQSTTPAEALSAEEPAPVAEAEVRVTHEGARKAVRSGFMPKLLLEYIDQQEANSNALHYWSTRARELEASGKAKQEATGQATLTQNAATAAGERDELKAKLSEAERKLAEVRTDVRELSQWLLTCDWHLPATIVTIAKRHVAPSEFVVDMPGSIIGDGSKRWQSEASAAQEPTGGEPAKPAPPTGELEALLELERVCQAHRSVMSISVALAKLVALRAKSAQQADLKLDNCGNCHACAPESAFGGRMRVCPTCGNKRCPKAAHHILACTGSNEPGQIGVAEKPAQAEQKEPAIGSRWAVCADRTLLLTVRDANETDVAVLYDHGVGGWVTREQFAMCFRPHREPVPWPAQYSTPSAGVPVAATDSGEAIPRETAETGRHATDNPAGERGDFRVGQRVRFWMGRGTVDAKPASAGRTWVRLTESGALTCPETRLLEPDYEADPAQPQLGEDLLHQAIDERDPIETMNPQDEPELELRIKLPESAIRKLEALDKESMIGWTSLLVDLIDRAHGSILAQQPAPTETNPFPHIRRLSEVIVGGKTSG